MSSLWAEPAPLARLLGVAPPPPPPPPPVNPEALAAEAYAEGLAAARLQAAAHASEMEAAHQLALAAVEARAAAWIEAAALELAEAARALARAVLAAEPQVPAATLATLVKEVIDAAESPGALHLNPDDLPRLSEAAAAAMNGQKWTLVADPSVPSGQVLGKARGGLLVASLARRAHALLGHGGAS